MTICSHAIMVSVQQRLSQRLRISVVINFCQHLQIAVSQQARCHVGLYSLSNPERGPGMAQLMDGQKWDFRVLCVEFIIKGLYLRFTQLLG